VENLTAALLIAGGVTMLASVAFAGRLTPARREAIAPVQALLATVLLVIGVSWIIRGPTRPFAGPPLVTIALVGVSYGAIAAGVSLAFPKQTPRLVQGAIGTLCVVAGVLLLLFQFRVIKPM
jgi:hypothetical protein